MFTLIANTLRALIEGRNFDRTLCRIARVLGLAVVLALPTMTEVPGIGVGFIQAAPLSDKGPRLKGRYQRDDYGYAVDIGNSVIAFGPTCDADGVCGSTHGFSGTLAIDKKAEIYLFPEYSPAIGNPPKTAQSNREVFDYIISTSHPDGTQPVIISSTEGQLGTLPALRVVAKFRNREASSETTIDVIFALRVVSAAHTILYRIGLAAPSANYARDKTALDALVASFRIIPLA